MAIVDSGKQARFKILRDEAERKIVAPLRLHNWIANIDREVDAGEYLVISAERAGVSRRVAIFYTSATENGAYKQAATEVEHIFFRGEPYLVDLFTYGLN